MTSMTEADRCEICGETFQPSDEQAEMWAPLDPETESVICHAQCGLDKNLEIA